MRIRGKWYQGRTVDRVFGRSSFFFLLYHTRKASYCCMSALSSSGNMVLQNVVWCGMSYRGFLCCPLSDLSGSGNLSACRQRSPPGGADCLEKAAGAVGGGRGPHVVPGEDARGSWGGNEAGSEGALPARVLPLGRGTERLAS